MIQKNNIIYIVLCLKIIKVRIVCEVKNYTLKDFDGVIKGTIENSEIPKKSA